MKNKSLEFTMINNFNLIYARQECINHFDFSTIWNWENKMKEDIERLDSILRSFYEIITFPFEEESDV